MNGAFGGNKLVWRDENSRLLSKSGGAFGGNKISWTVKPSNKSRNGSFGAFTGDNKISWNNSPKDNDILRKMFSK
jgi:hypothetical protein